MAPPKAPAAAARVELNDETLRDGLQSPSVADPPLGRKQAALSVMSELGVDAVSLGLPAAGPRQREHVEALLREVVRQRLALDAHCAARTTPEDLAVVADLQQRVGARLSVYAFLGTSPIRRFAEGWAVDHLLRTLDGALDFAERHALELAFVTEDTTRSRPEELARLFGHALGRGVRRLVLCDTVGHAVPRGVVRLVRWVQASFPDQPGLRLDWHGHDDRGLAVANAMAAIEAGVHRVHGTLTGAGERAGNTPLERLLDARAAAGGRPRARGALHEYRRLLGPSLGLDAASPARGVVDAAPAALPRAV